MIDPEKAEKVLAALKMMIANDQIPHDRHGTQARQFARQSSNYPRAALILAKQIFPLLEKGCADTTHDWRDR